MIFELEPFGVKMKLVEAGGVRTEFTHDRADCAAYEPMASQVREFMEAGSKKAAGPEGVAKVIFKAATDGQARLRYSANGAAPLLWLNRPLPPSFLHGLLRQAFIKAPPKQTPHA